MGRRLRKLRGDAVREDSDREDSDREDSDGGSSSRDTPEGRSTPQQDPAQDLDRLMLGSPHGEELAVVP